MDDLYGTLLSYNVEPTKKLHTAVSCNLVDDVEELIQSGIDVNVTLQKHGGDRALHIAASKGYARCVEKLLQAGANPDLPNDFGIRPISRAIKHNHVDCVRILYSTGSILADPSLTWNDLSPGLESSPMWINYSPEMIKCLLIATPRPFELSEEKRSLLYTRFIKSLHSKDLVRIFFLVGHKVTNEQLQELQANVLMDEDMGLWLKSLQGAQSLQHYARIVIRSYLRPNTLYGVKLLPLPAKLQAFLIFA